MASKVAEANAGVHSLAMAVAVSMAFSITTVRISHWTGRIIASYQLANVW